jgi:hypothetical protein
MKVKTNFVNYNPPIHGTFPILTSCKVYKKNDIINVYLEATGMFENLVDDIGYDAEGKHLLISYGQWHHTETGLYIPNEVFYDLDEFEFYNYDYVSAEVKIYVKGDFRACYHNDCDRKLVISFIPYKMINFTEDSADQPTFQQFLLR